MLPTATSFPYPGSIALFDGLRWRVMRHHADGTALIGRDGDGSSFTRTAPIEELFDPAEADRNALLSMGRTSEGDTRIALWIARRLAHRNEIGLGILHRDAQAAARAGTIPTPQDNRHISHLLRQLGWAKRGYTGAGYDRSPLYVRTTDSDAGQAQDIAA